MHTTCTHDSLDSGIGQQDLVTLLKEARALESDALALEGGGDVRRAGDKHAEWAHDRLRPWRHLKPQAYGGCSEVESSLQVQSQRSRVQVTLGTVSSQVELDFRRSILVVDRHGPPIEFHCLSCCGVEKVVDLRRIKRTIFVS